MSWHTFPGPQDAYNDAQLAVIGVASPSERTASLFGVTVPLYEITVVESLKGDLADEPLLVAPTPQTCMGAPENPTLPTDERMILLLTKQEGVWRPMTPYEGVIPAPLGEPLPFER